MENSFTHENLQINFLKTQNCLCGNTAKLINKFLLNLINTVNNGISTPCEIIATGKDQFYAITAPT